MVDYEMDEVCSACGAPAGEPCRPDCTGICCDTGETQEVKALRSEVARLRHALDECRAAMREANDLTSLAMSEGLRQCDHMRVRLKVNAKKRRGLKYALACALRGIKRSDERTSKYARKWFFASDVARLAMSEGLRAVEEIRANTTCLHAHTERGANIPLRHGSYRSEVCTRCGAFRARTHHDTEIAGRVGRWRPATEFAKAIATDDEI